MKFVGMGDNVVDRYINKKIMFPGGNAVNFAVYAKKCGFDSAYLGVLADDEEGNLIRDSLIAIGVDISACEIDKNAATERCDVVLVDGDRKFVGSGWEEGKEHRDLELGEKELDYLENFQVIHCGCYAAMEDEIFKIKGLQAIKTFDFSSEEEYREESYLKKICPNIDIALFSAEKLSRKEMDNLQNKVRNYGTPYVLITNGKKGQIFYDGIKATEGQVKLVEAVDTMGAGDSFFAAFVASLVKSSWNKEKRPDEKILRKAFSDAANFSADNCLTPGSFGYGKSYE